MKMRKKFVHVFVSLLLLVSVVAMAIPAVQAAGNTYYVDASGGNDSNSGQSSTSAWKTLSKVNNTTFSAGDRILLKCGSTWTEPLWLKGSGSASNPIVVSSYGSGNKPVINAQTVASGALNASVYLYNQSYITIDGLEITNSTNSTDPKFCVKANPQDGYTMKGLGSVFTDLSYGLGFCVIMQ